MADPTKIARSIEGQGAEASAPAGDPVLVGGDDGSVVRNIATDSTGRIYVRVVQGQVAADGALSAVNPIAVAAQANANEPTAVDADGDAVYFWADRLGRLVTVDGHPSPEAPVSVNATSSGDTEVIAAPGASVSLYIQKVTMLNAGSQAIVAQLQEDASAVNRGGGELAANGGGVTLDFGARGWKLTANTALDVNLGAAGDVQVNVTQYYIAP